MSSGTKKVLSLLLALIMTAALCLPAAAVSDEPLPVVVISGIESNPIIDKDTGEVLFDPGMLTPDLLFASGFPENFEELFSAEVIKELSGEDKQAMDIVTTLAEYLGFSDDITKITNKLIELITPLLADMELDMSNFDIKALLGAIDWQQIAVDLVHKLEQTEKDLKRIRMKEDGTPEDKKTSGIPAGGNIDWLNSEYPDAAEAALGNLATTISDVYDTDYTYLFTYDWRLSPIANAKALNTYIEGVVRKETGSKKIDLISEGYGSTIAVTYLAKHAERAKKVLQDFITVSSAFEGTSLAADIYTGNLPSRVFDIEDYSRALVRFINDRSDNPITGGAAWIAAYTLAREWEIQELGVHIIDLINGIARDERFAFIRDFLKYTPGLWALVPFDYYGDALDHTFGYIEPEGGGEELNANKKLAAAIDEFKELQEDPTDILLYVRESGVRMDVVALWNVQMLPIGKNCGVQSDGFIDTAYQSFGATCIDLNEVAEAMQAVQQEDTDHDHMSNSFDALDPLAKYAGRCHYIDASTCVLPENTWFIHNMKHDTWDSASNSTDFLIWLIEADHELEVWEETAYPQFMQYNRYVNPGVLSNNGYTYTHSDIPGNYLWGDADLDGTVTPADAVFAFRAAAGQEYVDEESVVFKNADVDSDGVITEDDATAILAAAGGLDPGHLSGINIEYRTEKGKLANAGSNLVLEYDYNPLQNTFALRVKLTEAEGLNNACFIIDYDDSVLKYKDATPARIDGTTVLAGKIKDGKLGIAAAGAKPVPADACDEDGSLTLATFSFLCPKDNLGNRIPVEDTVNISAGAASAAVDGKNVYVKPINKDLDKTVFLYRGDTDEDGEILANDARYVLRLSAKLEPAVKGRAFKLCDVDLDGRITAADARLILRASAGLIGSYVDF
ncbi:MAG: hypothetical protein K6G90_04675 [Clostridia bacterium]|nr:hypothetical protein [Clostridia bacterium]